jgi:hypothetical protein
MIESSWFPSGRRVTCFAVSAKLTFMGIIFLVTSTAGGRSALENIIFMACVTGDISVLPDKFKTYQIMVKLGGFPTVDIMAGFTAITESAFMRIILSMAIETQCGCVLHISQSSGVEMAFRTDYTQVGTGQRE